MTVSRCLHLTGLAALCCVFLLLSGCWDRVEVNDLAVVTAAGIDKLDGSEIELSVQMFIPRGGGQSGNDVSGGGGGQGQSFVRSATGRTIADAMMQLQEKLSRRIFWGHNEVFVIGSKLANEGVQEHIDFMVRNPQIRESSYLFICQGDVKKLLALIPPLERSSSEVLRELATSKIGVKVKLKDVIQRLQGDAEAVALPWIEELPKEPGQDRQTSSYITGSAILKKGRLVGRINDELTRGVLWLRGEIEQATITVELERPKGKLSMKLIKARSQLIPKIEDDQWIITLRIETDDDVVLNGTRLNLGNPAHTRMLEREMEDEIRIRVKETLKQIQKKMKADIFGFADAFHRRYPGIWKKEQGSWDEIFPEVEVRYDIHAHIRRPGMNSVPAAVPEKDVIP